MLIIDRAYAPEVPGYLPEQPEYDQNDQLRYTGTPQKIQPQSRDSAVPVSAGSQFSAVKALGVPASIYFEYDKKQPDLVPGYPRVTTAAVPR